tara:strand:+ start:669 stop:779 length:111 start_codon:yes stop_codon:yes gene_type:complete
MKIYLALAVMFVLLPFALLGVLADKLIKRAWSWATE